VTTLRSNRKAGIIQYLIHGHLVLPHSKNCGIPPYFILILDKVHSLLKLLFPISPYIFFQGFFIDHLPSILLDVGADILLLGAV
jgi:hypothetical protein